MLVVIDAECTADFNSPWQLFLGHAVVCFWFQLEFWRRYAIARNTLQPHRSRCINEAWGCVPNKQSVKSKTLPLLANIISNFNHTPFCFQSFTFKKLKIILRFAEKHGKLALEECCRDAVLHGKCNYTYISNTISMYVSPDETSSVDRLSNSLKPINSDTVVTGIYKDDDTKYF